jgi:hypothetical protein
MSADLRPWRRLWPAVLAAVYLVYLADAEFVLDDWWLLQHFSRAASVPEMARSLVENRLWGSFRTNGLSFLGVYGLWGIAGARPAVYFVVGVALHALLAWLLYRVALRLDLGSATALSAAALFAVLPTAHNPLFWFPSCAHYQFSALWLLLYLYSAAGDWTWRAGVVQAAAAALAFLSGDQVFGLLAGAAVWMTLVFRRDAAIRPAGVAWAATAAAAAILVGWINKAPIGGTLAAKFDFSASRLLQNLRETGADYWRLTGLCDGYYRLTGAAVAGGLVVGLGVWLCLRREPAGASWRAAALGAGWWALGYGPVLFLRWRELRYDYVPSVGLALLLSGLCRGPAMAAAVAGWSAATVVAEIEQCWRPQSRLTRAAARELARLENVRDHDIVAVAGLPDRIGTAPQFGMYLSYSATPFVETATGVFGLIVGRAILYDTGRLGLEHRDFFRPLRGEDLARAHVVACRPPDHCSLRTVLAREAESGRFELRPLKNYRGPPLDPARRWSREELHDLEPVIYFSR